MIKLFIMDVDGTLTDGGLYYDNFGNEFKKFNVKDGAGIVRLHQAGVKTMILTGRKSQCVEKRAKELGIHYVEQGISDKVVFLKTFLEEKGLKPEEIAYIGDDWNDLDCIRLAGHCGCPKDAAEEIKEIASFVSSKNGGAGAVREYAEHILKHCLHMKGLEDEPDAWYTEHRVRAHASGAVDGVMYTNSREGLEESCGRGLKIIEVDLTVTKDGRVVLSHNFMPEVHVGLSEEPLFEEFMNSRTCGLYTPMSFEDLIAFMKSHPEIRIVADHPAKGLDQLKRIITYLIGVVDQERDARQIYDRLIIQVFQPAEYEWVSQLGKFKNLEFYFSCKRDIWGTMPYVVSHGVHTVSINKRRLSKELVGAFKNLGIKVFSPSVNETEEIREALSMGCWGITSDFRTEEELEEILETKK